MDYEKLKIPSHVAIIVDGNGRWAKEKGKSRSYGHKKGADNLNLLSRYIFSKGIKVLSLYVFSTENFKRSEEEVSYLMSLTIKAFKNEFQKLHEDNIKIIFSGRREPLPTTVLKTMDDVVELSKNNTGGIMNLCFNYGGRTEIIDATKKIIKSGIDPEDISEELFGKYLYNNLPDVDYMIRTSGEQRLSNFMLWQNSYAEFYFPETYFPDFNNEEFDKAILEYTKRDRRYGGIDYEN